MSSAKFLHLSLSFLIIFSIVSSPFASFAEEEALPAEPQEEAIEVPEDVTDIIVQFKEEEHIETVLEENNLTQTEALDDTGELVLVETEGDASIEEAIEELEQNPNVEFAEPNYRREMSVIATDDTYKDLLWAIYNSGQSVNGTSGTADADMDIDDAWDITSGTSSIIVAVIDSGVEYDHPDLADSMWDGTNCQSDLGDALGGCIHGYDYENEDSDPMGDYFHGTHVAGTIGATKDNGEGIIGVAPETKIMALRFALNVSSEVKAINFAIQNGAKIINASFSGPGFSYVELAALEAFQESGGIFVAAASNNDGNNNDATPYYPASYDLPNIISVAATDQNDELASFSNIGATSVDVGAPGVNIYSTTLNTAYAYSNGTSMASPHVAGLVALVWAAYPDLTAEEVKAIILNTGDPISALSGKTLTGKRVNAYNAVTGLTPRIGYTANDLLPSEAISHSTDGAGAVAFDFYIKAGLEGIPVTIDEIEYSLDEGATWATSSLGSEFEIDEESLETGIDFSGSSYELIWNTQENASTSALATDEAMIRFKADTSATSSPYVYSSAFDIDNETPDLEVDSIATSTTEEEFQVISGESEAEAAIDVARNGIFLAQHTIPSGTSTFSISADLAVGENIFSVSSHDEWGNRTATTTLSTITQTEPEEEEEEEAPRSSGGGGGGGGSSRKTAATAPSIASTTPTTIIFNPTNGRVVTNPSSAVIPPASASFAFTRNLTLGATGEDVRQLQIFLNTHGFPVSLTGIGSTGFETTYFGMMTRAALARYQAANGIIPSLGYFGPITRGKISL